MKTNKSGVHTHEQLYDVVSVNMGTNKVLMMAQGKTLANAEAIVKLAVMRRGVNEEFFAEVPTNQYKTGDYYSNDLP